MYVNWLVFKEAGEAYVRFFHAQGMQLHLFIRRFNRGMISAAAKRLSEQAQRSNWEEFLADHEGNPNPTTTWSQIKSHLGASILLFILNP